MQSMVIEKFSLGIGGTGPTPGNAEQAELADGLVNQLLEPDFYVAADGVLVARCIDERLRELLRSIASSTMAPNAAGGTMSLTIMDILTGGKITGETGTLLERHERMMAYLISKGLPVGVHEDNHDHSADNSSGCGACDQLGAILALLLERFDDFCDVVTQLTGIEIGDDERAEFRRQLEQMPEVASGKEILALAQALPEGQVLIERMLGVHDALAATINFVYGTTLDREALKHQLKLSAFNIDAWAFEPSARLVYGDDEAHVRLAVIALCLYNFATSAKLCNSELRIAVRH